MFDNITLEHYIERKIVHVLMFAEYARFTDLRPKGVDSNLFSYHLKALIKQGYVSKEPQGYTLSHKGMQYVDRISATGMKLRTQPKIITMLFIQRPDSHVLLQRRGKQPYINTWTLPYGKLHIDDTSLESAAIREAEEKLGYTTTTVSHLGDCYIRVMHDGLIENTTLTHVLALPYTDITDLESMMWASPADLESLHLAPAVQQIIACCAQDRVFFEEFTVVK